MLQENVDKCGNMENSGQHQRHLQISLAKSHKEAGPVRHRGMWNQCWKLQDECMFAVFATLFLFI